MSNVRLLPSLNNLTSALRCSSFPLRLIRVSPLRILCGPTLTGAPNSSYKFPVCQFLLADQLLDHSNFGDER